MLYSILIYAQEGLFDRLPPEEQEAALDKHRTLQAKHKPTGTLAGVAKLMGTGSAVTLRDQGGTSLVLDGPFAETKEQLLGFYMIECASLDEAVEAAKILPKGIASYEIRPVSWPESSEEARALGASD